MLFDRFCLFVFLFICLFDVVVAVVVFVVLCCCFVFALTWGPTETDMHLCVTSGLVSLLALELDISSFLLELMPQEIR